MKTMKAIEIPQAGADFCLVERPIPEPKANQVRIKVQACGICHSDRFVKENLFPGIQYPRVPGHEVVGVVDGLGEAVRPWSVGQRVGVGWHGGHCFVCDPCRRGDFLHCHEEKICGISYDGGYQEYMIVPQEALVSVPDDLDAMEAAPLLCAGITTYNALRHSGAQPGDVVVIQGIGGLGHLAIQFAQAFGYRTVAISGNQKKKDLAKQLGAHRYLSAADDDIVAELQALGGAKVVLATAPNSAAITSIVNALGIDGRVIVVGAAAEPIEISPLQLITGRHQLTGWPSGHAKDSEDTLQFCDLTQIKPMIETYPLEQAAAAYERMMSNQARFRVVLKINTD